MVYLDPAIEVFALVPRFSEAGICQITLSRLL